MQARRKPYRILKVDNRSTVTVAESYAERLIGSIRRECLDHLIVLNEKQLRRILREYLVTTMECGRISHYKECAACLGDRTASERQNHFSPTGCGLHHRYLRAA